MVSSKAALGLILVLCGVSQVLSCSRPGAPSGKLCRAEEWEGGADGAPARMEPPFSALEGSLFPRDAIPVLGHPALHIQA